MPVFDTLLREMKESDEKRGRSLEPHPAQDGGAVAQPQEPPEQREARQEDDEASIGSPAGMKREPSLPPIGSATVAPSNNAQEEQAVNPPQELKAIQKQRARSSSAQGRPT